MPSLFISDLHLTEERPEANERFIALLEREARSAEALYILGDFFGFGGYGFKSKRWQYEAGAELYFGQEFRFILGGEAHDRTASQDEWIIPELENSLAASLINEDFRDYYRHDGFSFFATQYFGRSTKLTGAYRYDNGETDEGGAFVYLGSASSLATTPAWTAEGNQESVYFGGAVAKPTLQTRSRYLLGFAMSRR